MVNMWLKGFLHLLRVVLHQDRSTPVYTTLKIVFRSSELFCLWHDRQGHPDLRMIINIINNSNGHMVNVKKFPNPDDFTCSACATGELIIRPPPKGK
jgi:hypothetical protein